MNLFNHNEKDMYHTSSALLEPEKQPKGHDFRTIYFNTTGISFVVILWTTESKWIYYPIVVP